MIVHALEALASVESQLARLDKEMQAQVRRSKPCWHLSSVPCIGPITALAFLATIEDPERFKRSRDVGANLGLTPKRYQSGERDIVGAISKQGDGMARHYLYEAVNCMLTTWSGRSQLKSRGLQLARRLGAKRARVAVVRKLGYLLLRLWKDGSHYEESYRQTASDYPGAVHSTFVEPVRFTVVRQEAIPSSARFVKL